MLPPRLPFLLLLCVLLLVNGEDDCPHLHQFVNKIGGTISSSILRANIVCTTSNCSQFLCNGTLPKGLGRDTLSIELTANIDACAPAVNIDVNLGATTKKLTLRSGDTSAQISGHTVQFHSNIAKVNASVSNINVTVSSRQLSFAMNFVGYMESACSTTKPTASPKLGTTKPATTKPATTKSATTKSATTKSATTKSATTETTLETTSAQTTTIQQKVTTTTKPPTTQKLQETTKTKTIKPTTHKPTAKPPPTTKTVKNPTTVRAATVRTKQSPTKAPKTTQRAKIKRTSRATRAFLLILAILILICVLALVIYCRKKKRLSDLPAYYNDIVINDPLKMEMENEDGELENDEDGDELPLFS